MDQLWLSNVQIQCDQATPRCSRCERLDLECIGAGVQRFKFKSHNAMQVAPTRSQTRSPSCSTSSGTIELTPIPNNTVDRLLGELVYITSSATSLRYNFVYAYGGFLLQIPQHLGVNEALDASTKAVISAYTGFCRGDVAVTPRTLLLYSRALAALRLCLDDPAKACSSETLSAVMILMICQVSTSCTMNMPETDVSRISSVPKEDDGPHIARVQHKY